MDDQQRREKVDKACQWYRSNRATIEAMLPLRVPMEANPRGHYYYQENWNIECWCVKWEAGDRRFTLDEAETLISGQLRPLFSVVRDRLSG